MSNQKKVQEFMRAAGQSWPDAPLVPDEKTCDLRVRLIQEELDELRAAIEAGSVVEAADAIADLLYVVYGAAVSFGFDADAVFSEVHRSNMTKFIDGHRREDGKWIKGPSYTPADIASALRSGGVA